MTHLHDPINNGVSRQWSMAVNGFAMRFGFLNRKMLTPSRRLTIGTIRLKGLNGHSFPLLSTSFWLDLETRKTVSRTSVYSSGANNHCVAPHKGRYLFSPIDAHGFQNRFFRIGGKAMVGGSMLVSSKSFDSHHCFWEHHYGRKRQTEFLFSSTLRAHSMLVRE